MNKNGRYKKIARRLRITIVYWSNENDNKTFTLRERMTSSLELPCQKPKKNGRKKKGKRSRKKKENERMKKTGWKQDERKRKKTHDLDPKIPQRYTIRHPCRDKLPACIVLFLLPIGQDLDLISPSQHNFLRPSHQLFWSKSRRQKRRNSRVGRAL